MDRAQAVALVIAVLAGCGNRGPVVRVGSKNFTESVLVGEIVAQQLERRLHVRVERQLNLGGTLLAHQALTTGQIDVYPEYTGTALTAILKLPVESDPAAVLTRVRDEYRRRFHVAWLDPLGVNNTFAMVVRGADARRMELEALSQASKFEWVLGAGYEFEQRPDGLPALQKAYGFRWRGSPHSMDLGLLYQALEQGQVTMIAANATDGMLAKMDLKVLADDRHAFPPYQLCIVTREDTLSRMPGLREALGELKLSDEIMRHLNYQVDGEHRPVAQVAREFLAR